MPTTDVRPGMHVRITQSVQRREQTWETDVVGKVVAVEPQQTGSWYAHARRDKYWLLRIKLQKDDGELTLVALDQNTRIAVLDDPSAAL